MTGPPCSQAGCPWPGSALLIGLFSIPRALGNQPTDEAKPRFDLPGSALVLSLLLCLMIGLRLGQAIGWTSIPVLVLLAASPPILVALIRVERAAESPVLPGALVRLSGFQTAVGAMFLGHFSQFVIWFIFPFYITDALGRGPVTLGIMLAVMSNLQHLSSPVGGWLCDRWGVRPVGAAGLMMSAIGLCAMSMLDAQSAVWHVAVGIAVVGLGVGWYQSAAYALMLGTCLPSVMAPRRARCHLPRLPAPSSALLSSARPSPPSTITTREASGRCCCPCLPTATSSASVR